MYKKLCAANYKRYFNFLCYKVNGGFKTLDHRILMDILFQQKFYVSGPPADMNRYSDGLSLREEASNHIPAVAIPRKQHECSVLEVLVALACRLDTITYDHTNGHHPERFFFAMLQNMGLMDHTDDLEMRMYPISSNRPYINPEKEAKVRDILLTWLDRRYDENGQHGCPFILGRNKNHIDMRQIEIWAQAQAWLNGE